MRLLSSAVILGLALSSLVTVDAQFKKPRKGTLPEGSESGSRKRRLKGKKEGGFSSDEPLEEPTAPDSADVPDASEPAPEDDTVPGPAPPESNVPDSSEPAPEDDTTGRLETPAPTTISVRIDSPTSSPWPTSTGDDGGETSLPVGADEDISSIPSDFPSLIPSAMPSDLPSLVPSEKPSPSPSPTPSLTEPEGFASSNSPPPSPSLTELEGPTSSYIQDPVDPSSFVCMQDNEETTYALNEPLSLPVTYIYQLRLDDPATDLALVLATVELAIAKAVAEVLLSCEGNDQGFKRRLIEGVWSVSALPEDSEIGQCSTGCHLIGGGLTLQTVGTTGDEKMAIACSALDVVKDDATLTKIATAVDGVGAIRFESSAIWCGSSPTTAGGSNNTDSLVTDESGNALRATGSDPTLGSGATVGIAMAGLVVLVAFMLIARRRRLRHPDYVTEAGSKDMLSLQQTFSSVNNREYTILADNQSIYDESSERREDMSSPSFSKSPAISTRTEEHAKSPNLDLFRFDQSDLPDRVSLKSSEGGSSDEDEGSDTLAHYATPIQLAAQLAGGKMKSPPGSSPQRSLQVNTSLQSSSPAENSLDEPNESNMVSPAFSGLSSLLGATESDGSTTDEDRSVVQLVQGGALLLKMSDLEGQDENSSSSGSE